MVRVGIFAVECLLAGFTSFLEGSLGGSSGGSSFGSEDFLVEGFLRYRWKGRNTTLHIVKTTV